MFGMSLSEIIMIAVVAIIALGPDKLPKAMYEMAKLFKVFKKSINEARSSFEQEIKIAELKEDAKKYKEKFTQTQESVRKKLTFEELEDLKKGINSTKQSINDSFNDIKKELNNTENLTQISQNNTSQSATTKDEKATDQSLRPTQKSEN